MECDWPFDVPECMNGVPVTTPPIRVTASYKTADRVYSDNAFYMYPLQEDPCLNEFGYGY